MMNIQVFHAYNRLSDDGFVKPLVCRYCDQKLITRIDNEDNPYLLCVFCNVSTHPSIGMYKDILAVVREHSD